MIFIKFVQHVNEMMAASVKTFPNVCSLSTLKQNVTVHQEKKLS